ncbi:MAG: pyrimidine 5'-nucleotidase [Vibrio sp.]
MTIQDLDWVLFDADETLFRFDGKRGLKMMFSRHGVELTEQDLADYQSINAPLWVAYQNGEISAKTLQVTRFESWAKRLNVSAEQLNHDYMMAMADICEPLDGALNLMEALHGKVKLGIITNGFTALQDIRLERTGFKHFFDLLVISEQVGVAKPDVAIFEYALERMPTRPQASRVLMVGDNPHSDILGGQNAGMKTCWLNEHGKEIPEGVMPSMIVPNLDQLKKQLCD